MQLFDLFARPQEDENTWVGQEGTTRVMQNGTLGWVSEFTGACSGGRPSQGLWGRGKLLMEGLAIPQEYLPKNNPTQILLKSHFLLEMLEQKGNLPILGFLVVRTSCPG